ncbi:hypothetical protein [Paraburkholderia hospita]|uniref:hypothetical protein n=1 Tax=Paraburkholderia hospita TaxID=169430 RepID=UPI000271618E|nr:hypothetical protein [Paraburkholderia hospita]SKC94373.1 hypothetical protein SAMN06266956_6251 [Paraburkholderia hospita]
MNRVSLSQNAFENAQGEFIEAGAVDSLLANQKDLRNLQRQFQSVLAILHNREQLTLVTVLNLAESIRKSIPEPVLAGRRYRTGDAPISPPPAGDLVVRVEETSALWADCLSLFDKCEKLQSAIHSEIHKIHSKYVFTYRHSLSESPLQIGPAGFNENPA